MIAFQPLRKKWAPLTAFDRLEIGERHEGAPSRVDPDLVSVVVSLAGYVHPLFTDADFLADGPFPGPPVPGGLLLTLLGGMAEQLDVFDHHVVALIGYDEVRFERPALVGAVLTPAFTLTGLEIAESGRGGVAVWDWELRDEARERVCLARARLRTH